MARRFSTWRIAGLSLSLLVVFGGVYVVLASLHARRASTTTVDTAAAHPDAHVSTVKPSPKAVAAYTVPPDLPKYLKIPSLGVDARIFSVGLNSSGAIGTPGNVFDTAWYDGSSRPGQPGAMLIDGHISSWTSPGVFYHLTNLRIGGAVQVVRGDNKIFNYKVVKTVVYPSNKVDMHAVLSPVTPGRQGLNLISCTGDVIAGTSEFNERVVVFTEETQ